MSLNEVTDVEFEKAGVAIRNILGVFVRVRIDMEPTPAGEEQQKRQALVVFYQAVCSSTPHFHHFLCTAQE